MAAQETETRNAQLVIRRANHDDIPFIAWCNYEATSPKPGFCYWDPLLEGLNTDTMAFIKAVFNADALAWGSPEEFFIVEEDGKPVGGASGFMMDEQDYRPLRLDRLPQVAHSLGWTDEMLAQFRQGYEQVWSDPHDTTLAPSAPWIIECVAVVPEARGRGIAKQLMKALLDEGRRRGSTHAAISVTLGNEPARRVYEGVGFQMYITYGAEYFDHQFPGTIKYRISLN
jgi:ribosomal protein S18 acetylase RimI-like enzyme